MSSRHCAGDGDAGPSVLSSHRSNITLALLGTENRHIPKIMEDQLGLKEVAGKMLNEIRNSKAVSLMIDESTDISAPGNPVPVFDVEDGGGTTPLPEVSGTDINSTDNTDSITNRSPSKIHPPVPGHIAPEVAAGGPVSVYSNIFSLGPLIEDLLLTFLARVKAAGNLPPLPQRQPQPQREDGALASDSDNSDTDFSSEDEPA
ncbi:hypothetical protein Bbelb_406930 [Branchiostoma belcheri]|nr:hypothetical protein Bbelb_406930 [Branchiostoma belcheri]